MRTCEENLARRRWASAAPAARAATQDVEEKIIRLANHPRLSYQEKQQQLAQLRAQPQGLVAQEAALRQLLEARTKAAVDEWGSRQRFSRTYARRGPDVSEPSRFNGRRTYTTR